MNSPLYTTGVQINPCIYFCTTGDCVSHVQESGYVHLSKYLKCNIVNKINNKKLMTDFE